MKKCKIAVTVFAGVIAAASFVKAESCSVDFDRGSFRSTDFIGSVNHFDALMVTNKAAHEIPATEAVSNTMNTLISKLPAPGLQKLRAETLNMPWLSKEFLQLINDGKTVVLYNNEGLFLTTPVGENSYYMRLESNDRKLLEFLSKQKTEALHANLQNKSWVTKCRPVIKILWKWVKEAWVAYEITQEICKEEWVNDSPSTPNDGMGGNGPWPVRSAIVH